LREALAEVVARGSGSAASTGAPTATGRLPNGLPAEITKSLVSLWTQYAGKAPSDARTEIRGNVVTCVLIDAVGDYNRSMIAPQARDTVQGAGKPTPAAYKREAVAAVVRLTRQRVSSFVSSHDRDTDVATEVFTLEPSFRRGAPPPAERRPGDDLRLFPPGRVL
jgi:Na+-translocating membrane potential-generating system MpsC-like protein